MISKKLFPVLLMGSALILTGCGGGNSSSSTSSSEAVSKTDLEKLQDELKRIELETQKIENDIAVAEAKMAAKKIKLDDLQAKLEKGQVSADAVVAANAEYEAASEEVTKKKQDREALNGKVRQQKEKVDVSIAAFKLNASLNNLVPSVLSGSFSKDDFDIFVNSVQTQSGAQLVAPTNKAIADLKSELSTGAKIKTAVPRLINSPIFDSLVIPWVVESESRFMQETIGDWFRTFSENLNGNVFVYTEYPQGISVGYKKKSDSAYTLDFPTKDAIKRYTADLKYLGDGMEAYYAVQDYIDEYFRKNPSKIQAVAKLDFDMNDPNVLMQSLQSEVKKLKPILNEAIGQMPIEWVNWMAQQIQRIPNVNTANMETFKRGMAQLAQKIAENGLSSEMPASSSGLLSYRQARSANPGLDLHHLTIDGQSMDQSYSFGLPVHVQLKGDLNTVARTGDVSGFVTYNLNGTMIGFAQALGNAHDQHSESSLVMSHSFNNFFAEVQMGVVGIRESLFSGWEGQRYQATLGYDAAYASPFVQLEYRPLSNGFNTLDATGVYVGLETDALKVQLPEATFTSRLLTKIGYESSAEKLFGEYSMKANGGASAYVEWSSGLFLSNGLELATGLTLGSKDVGFKMNVSFEN